MDFKKILSEYEGKNYELHKSWVNPQFVKVLQTIGLDACYTKAEGITLYDIHGAEYRDFLSGYGVFALGRNHPEIKKGLKDFIDLDTANLVQMEAPFFSSVLAKRLLEFCQLEHLRKVFFTNSGTESIEGAIKFARAATGKEKILHLDHSFHGLSSGSLSLNGSQEFRKNFGTLLPSEQLSFGDIESLKKALHQKDVAAFVVEVVQGKGVFIHPDDYLIEAQNLCRQNNVLFIVDEVQTGLCRTGKNLALHHYGLKPDMVTLSKALSGGMVPIGAILYTDEIYKSVFSKLDRCVVHSSTFGQNNLAMACGLITLDLLDKLNMNQRSQEMGTYLLEKLQILAKESEWIKEVRGKGLMIGIEFGKPKTLKNKLKWNMIHQMDKGLFGELIVIPLFKKHRILTQVSGHHQDIIKLIPPLILEKSDADYFVNSLRDVLDECGKISGPLWDLAKNLMASSKENRA